MYGVLKILKIGAYLAQLISPYESCVHDYLNSNTGQPIYIYCRVGFRSYLAYRILKQKGFEKVSILAGGSKTLNFFCRTKLATGKPGVPFVAQHAEEKLAEMPGALKNS